MPTTAPGIVTERTQIRLLQLEHAPLLQQYHQANREHLAPWEPRREDEFYSLAACQQRIATCQQQFEQGSGFAFIVLPRAADGQQAEMIASCNFNNIVRGIFQACHLGYSIAAAYQGQGLMQEALRAAIDYMFEQADLHRIMANYLPHNQRSGRLLERLGFEREGLAKKYLKINGVWQDHVLTALVRQRD
ncbi:MAG: hypothetical protein RL748_1001 [Pseudomonadota bacterium]|jgi:ribosomal-protein-alanine N-acetyltransferase